MLPILWFDFNDGNIAGSLPSELGLFCGLALLRLNSGRSPERLLHTPPHMGRLPALLHSRTRGPGTASKTPAPLAPRGRILPSASRR